jgi:hypothetical protein
MTAPERKSFSELFGALGSFAFRGRTVTLPLGAGEGAGEAGPATGVVPRMPALDDEATRIEAFAPVAPGVVIDEVTDVSMRSPMASLVVDVDADLAQQDEAAVPDVFGPRARQMSMPDGRGDMQMDVLAVPKIRPVTYSVLADAEGRLKQRERQQPVPSKPAARGPKVGLLAFVSAIVVVMVVLAGAWYFLRD